MVSLFRGSRTEPALPPQTVRVLVLGDASAGKTALSELIVTRKASRTPKSTAGCSVSVALWDAEDGGDASSGGGAALWDAAGGVARAPQTFFVEIWDVSANPYYEQLRRSLYKQINGVILVYDATDKSALRRLAKWASEVASDGTFVAPFPDDTAARNIGGLPVPVLIVANKSDRLRGGGAAAAQGALALESTLSRLCGGTGGAGAGVVGWLCDALRGLRGGGRGSGANAAGSGGLAGGGSAANLSELESSIRSVSASAACGQLDWATVGAFFTALWARRYQPSTRSAAAFLQQVPSGSRGDLCVGVGVGGGGSALFAPGGSGVVARRMDDADDSDRRLDDYV